MNRLVKCYCPFNTSLPAEQLLDFLTRQFPGAPFDKTINIDGELVQLEDAALFIKDTITHQSRIPLITNGDEQSQVELSGFAMKQPWGYGGETIWYFIIEIMDDVQPTSPYVDLLEELSSLLYAYWGIINDKNTEKYAALQMQPSGFERATKLGLPRLMKPQAYRSPYIPTSIAWLNFWSPQTLEQLRIDTNTLKEQVYTVKQTSDAGLLFQLTADMLSVQNQQHLQTLINMYAAYPDVGGRRIQP